MKPIFDDPGYQQSYERGHPFFVALAWAKEQDREDLETIYANDHNNQLQADKRLKQVEDFADNLIERFAKLGENTTALRGEFEKLKSQPLEALNIANETRSANAKLNHSQWQAWAAPVWKQHPTWKKNAVAAQIIEDHHIEAATQTVADILIKPQSD